MAHYDIDHTAHILSAACITGGDRTRVSVDTLVKMAGDSFNVSVNYREINRHGTFIGEPYFLRLLSLFGKTEAEFQAVISSHSRTRVDECDACLTGQMVIDISRFHFCYSCLFCPPFYITRYKTQ